MNKTELRSIFQQRRAQISFKRRLEAQKKLNRLCLSGYVLSFCSFGSEINTWELNQKLAREKRLALPLLVGKELHFYKVEDLGDLNVRHNFYEPDPDKCEPLSLIEGTVLVPGLAFDSHFHRLGYGGGYYDRFFQKYPHLYSIGLGFKEQHISSLPINIHDKSLTQLFLA